MARRAFERNAEIEFLKVMAVCNAIMGVGNNLASILSKSDGQSGGDALKKSISALEKMLVPHWAEDTEKRAKSAREKLVREASGGMLKIKVLGKDKKSNKRRR